MANEATVTIRVPLELKHRIDAIAHDLRISQSAVWKILISNYLQPAAEGNLSETLQAITLKTAAAQNAREPGREPNVSRALRP